MDEAIDVLNMDVGEFGVDESDDTLGQSSTQPNKSQTYVHMTDNAVHIKTLMEEKENSQDPEDFRQINHVINTAPIGRVGRKHAIISNAEAITKEGFEQKKHIKELKKENKALKRQIKEVESIKLPIERLKTFKPLVEGMDEVKGEVIEEVFAMVSKFMDALERVFDEER